MRLTVEKKATASSAEIRNKTYFLNLFGLVNYLYQNYNENSVTY